MSTLNEKERVIIRREGRERGGEKERERRRGEGEIEREIKRTRD